MQSDTDSAQVIALPPFIFFGGLIIGFLIDLLIPAPFVGEMYDVPVGLVIIGIGIFLIAWAVRTFNEAGTDVDVRTPTTKVVENGPYRYSRNPIYVGMILMLLGFAIWLNSLWILFALVPIIPLIDSGVIRREERYLERKFGAAYLDYKGRVRRWI